MSTYLDNGKYFPRTAKDIKSLLGKNIEYLLKIDVDRSGRGFFFPKETVIIETYGKNVKFENGDWHFWRDFEEYRVIETEEEKSKEVMRKAEIEETMKKNYS